MDKNVKNEIITRGREAMKTAFIDCPVCEYMLDDPQYTCTVCWCEGGGGKIDLHHIIKKFDLSDNKTTKYIISCGELKNVVIEADDPKSAFFQAIEQYKPKNLGMLFSVQEDGTDEDDMVYMSTRDTLKEAGQWEE